MTPRQKTIYEFYRNKASRGDPAPTFAEVAEGVGLSKATVYGHVDALVQKGWLIRISENRSRALSVPMSRVSRDEALRLIRAMGGSPELIDAVETMPEAQ